MQVVMQKNKLLASGSNRGNLTRTIPFIIHLTFWIGLAVCIHLQSPASVLVDEADGVREATTILQDFQPISFRCSISIPPENVRKSEIF